MPVNISARLAHGSLRHSAMSISGGEAHVGFVVLFYLGRGCVCDLPPNMVEPAANQALAANEKKT